MVRERIRLHFSKTGNLRFIGHRDLLRTMERLLRRSGLAVTMSEGFHPKQKVSYVSALALGMGSEDEVMEVIFDQDYPTEEILEKLNAVSVHGLVFHQASVIPEGVKKPSAASFRYEIPLPGELPSDLDDRIATLLASESAPVVKQNGKEVDLRPAILSLTRNGRLLELHLAVQTGPEAGVRELLVYLNLGDRLYKDIFPTRRETVLA